MSPTDIVDLYSGDKVQQKEYQKFQEYRRKDPGGNRISTALSISQDGISLLEKGQSFVDDTDLTSSSPICPAPLPRQFWKAGNYAEGLSSKCTLQGKDGKNHLHVHPMFLHSNATSHKWAFGAIAELLDNAIDEIQNGATCVILDKTLNPRDGSSALMIQDDGGGMDPEAMRHCMSFGFSIKSSKSTIGQYGNGFKTSTMRLGGDAIVFSRHLNNRVLTQSIGLLSYTFLTQTGHDRIVVPMVDYQFNSSTGILEILHQYGTEYFNSNMSVLLQWSPYSSEAELLKQFDGIGAHGTKIVIYNLWLDDLGNTELDFDTDLKDIRIGGNTNRTGGNTNRTATASDLHIVNQYHYSLRVYLSILYLRLPESFRIVLRSQVIEYHNTVRDLKFPEFIMYKPYSRGSVEGVITTIGFLREAPYINANGFNVYHKNRLILPFWKVASSAKSRGRGVVGVLEANFVEPTHNKQDFERTSLFQKLESRLKEMTWEYWDYHCHLIGYNPVIKKFRAPVVPDGLSHKQLSGIEEPVMLNQSSVAAYSKVTPTGGVFQGSEVNRPSIPNAQGRPEQGLWKKRKEHEIGTRLPEFDKVKKPKGTTDTTFIATQVQPASTAVNPLEDQKVAHLLLKKEKLSEKCLEHEKIEKELSLKVTQLRNEILKVQGEYVLLLEKLLVLDPPLEQETGVDFVSRP